MISSQFRRILVVTALAVAPVLTAAPADAMSVSGSVGGSTEGGVTCYLNPTYPNLNRVIVQAPMMSSSPVPAGNTFTVGGGWNGGGYHIQQVGYRAYLYRWNGTAWAYTGVASGLHTGQTADDVQPVNWSVGTGSSAFSTPGHGSYSVYLRFYWYADSQSPGGTASGWSSLYEQGRQRYCAF
jgi:hypothetical protein